LRQTKSPRPRAYARLDGGKGAKWDIPNNDLESVVHAGAERIFFTKDPKAGGFRRAPRPEDNPDIEGVGKERTRNARAFVQTNTSKFMQQLKSGYKDYGLFPVETSDAFVEHYTGSKRKIYAAAAESLRNCKLSKKDGRVKMFTKDEYRKPGGAPRAIQPRSPRFNVELGRYIKGMEHPIFEQIDLTFDPSGTHRTVAKGMNQLERGNCIKNMWDRFKNPVAVGLDASRFDQHINKHLLELEHSVYLAWSQGKGEHISDLQYLLKQQLINEGAAFTKDGKFEYTVDGCRMSGDMNTSLGNVIIMCCLMYSYFDSKGLKDRIALLNDGDDCVIIMDHKDLAHFREGLEDWFLKMGITMEYDGIYTQLEDIEFCQCRPVKVRGGYMLTPRPTKRLYSDLMTTKPIWASQKVWRKQVGAIAGCGIASSSGLPIYQNFYRWLGRSAPAWIPEEGDFYYKFRDSLAKGMEKRFQEPDIETRISYYFAFGILPEDQKLLERYYSGRQPLSPYRRSNYDPGVLTLDPIQRLAPPEMKEF
jgi:hypothetical protein